MCPTFMATGDEDKSTRGRANILREFLTRSERKYPWDHEEIYQVMDLCLSCKACKSECPSNVDMTMFKAEFLQHHYDIHGIPFRSWLVGWLPVINSLGMVFRPVTNFVTGLRIFKRIIGFEESRTVPLLSETTLRSRARRNNNRMEGKNGTLFLFADEFTNYNESDTGIKALRLLEKLGYKVTIPKHRESGRTFLSKGMLKNARKVAERNVRLLKDVVSVDAPLVGLEPSAILSFRDEYPGIVNEHLRDDARRLGECSILLEEFICREMDKGKIIPEQFTSEKLSIKLHGHCQQKAISSTELTKRMLSIPVNYRVEEIPSGCCGMAGAFGYEKEHYEMSMRIGEMVLFPEVRSAPPETVIAAPGTSCRHHIEEGTGKKALHPVEILWDALIKDEGSF